MAATAAASVGVKIPENKPPNRTSGSVIGIRARPRIAGSFLNSTGNPFGNPRVRATTAIATMSDPAIKNPGTTPPRNSAPTDAPDRSAYRIMGIDGGMIGAIVDAAAIRAAEKPAG